MSDIETNKRLTLAFFDAMQRGDANAIADTYADEGRVVTMGNTLISGSRGKEEIRGFAGGVLDAFPDGMILTPDGDACIIAMYNPNDVEEGETRMHRLSDGELIGRWTCAGSPRVTCPQLVSVNGETAPDHPSTTM